MPADLRTGFPRRALDKCLCPADGAIWWECSPAPVCRRYLVGLVRCRCQTFFFGVRLVHCRCPASFGKTCPSRCPALLGGTCPVQMPCNFYWDMSSSLPLQSSAAQLQSGGFSGHVDSASEFTLWEHFHAGRKVGRGHYCLCSSQPTVWVHHRVVRTLSVEIAAVHFVPGSAVQSLGAFLCFRALDVDITAVPRTRRTTSLGTTCTTLWAWVLISFDLSQRLPGAALVLVASPIDLGKLLKALMYISL